MRLDHLVEFGMWIYGYCTDFVINLANLLGLSYYEINAGMFIMLWPAVTIILVAVNILQSIRINRLVRRSAKTPT